MQQLKYPQIRNAGIRAKIFNENRTFFSKFQNIQITLLYKIKQSICPYDLILLIAVLIGLSLWMATGIPILQIRQWMVGAFFKKAELLGFSLLLVWAIRWFYLVFKYKRPDARIRRIMFARHCGWRTIARSVIWLIWLIIVLNIYTTIKQAIPLINPSIYDLPLIEIEKIIHLGFNPSWDLVKFSEPHWWVRLLDINYYIWFWVKPLIFAFFITHRKRFIGNRFFASYLCLWIFGVMIGLVIPSHGPCYVNPNYFPADGMIFCKQVQISLWEAYVSLDRINFFEDGGLTVGFGLMALPSLHVAFCALYASFFWKEGKILRLFSTIFLILTFLGSLYSGWHYAIDGYLGILLVTVVIFFVKKIELIISKRFKT